MGTDRSHKRIFQDALELSGEGRAAFVLRECEGDAALHLRVESLLSAHDDSDRFLATPSVAGAIVGATFAMEAEGSGTRIGPYLLVQKLGQGGFGAVFLAEQETPVRREVALKILRAGMDSAQVIARFEAERQALALMEHPNIARVFDAGTTASGRPFFAMELVRGEPIVAFCDRCRMPLEGRLALFQQVCAAVQHAHHKGVIHRDIKPSNVLVATGDGKPAVKVIDFGIAKATSARLSDAVLTEQRALIGTPEYMSPEQADPGAADIDTRSDVYGLGVLLYELLTGTTPFDGKRLRAAAYGEIQRILREEDPPRPSARLLADERCVEVAAARGTQPNALHRRLRGDLDWIAMRCLEKERARRYGTAEALALDVERHLEGAPITAAPPSVWYRVRKNVRRHRAVVLGAFLVLMTLIAGSIGTTVGMVRAREAEKDQAEQKQAAQQAALLAQNEAARADAAAEQARRARDQAQLSAAFLRQVLTGVGPDVALGRDTQLLREMMDGAATRIAAGELTAFPDADLTLRLTIGHVYRELGELDRAEQMFGPVLALAEARAGEPDCDAGISDALAAQALLLDAQGRPAQSLPLHERAVALNRRLHPDGHAEVGTSLANLATALHALGRVREAEALFRESLAIRRGLRPENPASVAASMNGLAECLRALGHAEEALALAQEVVATRSTLHAGDHPELAESLTNLGTHLDSLGRHEEGLAARERALAMLRRLLGEEHPLVAIAQINVAGSLGSLGRNEEALAGFEAARAMFRASSEGDQPVLAMCDNNIAAALRALGRYEEAQVVFESALAQQRRLFQGDHPAVAMALTNMAANLASMGRHAESVRAAEEAVAMFVSLYPDDHPDVAGAMHQLGREYAEIGRAGDALRCFERSLTMRERLTSPTDRVELLLGLLDAATRLTALGEHDAARTHGMRAVEVAHLLHPTGGAEGLVRVQEQVAALAARWDAARAAANRAPSPRRADC